MQGTKFLVINFCTGKRLTKQPEVLPKELEARSNVTLKYSKSKSELFNELTSKESREAEEIYIIGLPDKYLKELIEMLKLPAKVSLLQEATGTPKKIINKEHSKKVRAGIEAARKSGKNIGAPKKNRNRRGKLKEYNQAEVSKVLSFIEEGYTYREIIHKVSFPISISKISYIKKRFGKAAA